MFRRLLPILLVLVLPIGTACNEAAPTAGDTSTRFAPDGFDYRTTRDVHVRVSTVARGGAAIPYVRFSLLLDPADEGSLVAAGRTDGAGNAELIVPVATWRSELYLRTVYIGLPALQAKPILGDAVHFDGAGATPVVAGKAEAPSSTSAFVASASTAATTLPLRTLGTWSSNGYPSYLASPFNVDPQLLESLNATLPEKESVPALRPSLLGSGESLSTPITQSAEVWVSFIHEGTGWQNVLGFFTYPTGNPPTSIAQITDATVIFPKVSYATLASGDRVYLGRFNPGVTIGWFVIANGWSTGVNGQGDHIYFSIPALNPETNTAVRQHSVLLDDPARGILLLAFEDEKRDRQGNSVDHDFNDLVFAITATPDAAVRSTSRPSVVVVPPPPAPVEDWTTEVYIPSSGGTGTIAFEDLWPGLGDYDFNDLVVDYQYVLRLDASNKVVEMEASFDVRAIGAGYHNGLAIALPTGAETVASVAGSLTSGLFSLAANGVESGHANAVIPIFDDAWAVASRSPGYFVNTQPEAPTSQTQPVVVTIRFVAPIAIAQLGSAPFDPFLVADGLRGREVHLPGNPPTSKADGSLFGTASDASNPAAGRTYLSADNLPWALELPSPFAYPSEKNPITKAHAHFKDWAASGGTIYADWYLDKSGYRDGRYIY